MGRIIDISVGVYSGMRIHAGGDYDDYYGDPGDVQILNIRTPDMPGARGGTARRVTMLLHHGTHVDAPEHQIAGGKQISDYPLDRFIGQALLVDLSKARKQNGGDITPAELEEMVGKKIQGIDMLLFKQDETIAAKQRPRLDNTCYHWCADHGLKLMNGSDVFSRAPGQNAYRALLGNDILNLHNVANLDKIKSERVQLIVFPLKISPAEAAPARAIVIEE